MSFDYTTYGSYGDEKVVSTAKIGGLPLGACMELPDGRRFRHTRMGAAAAVPGSLYQGPACANANTIFAGGAISLAPNNAPVGAQTLSVTMAGTIFPASSATILDDGYLCIAASAGNAMGMTYKMKTINPAASTEAATITLADGEKITVALQAGTSFVTIIPNPYSMALLTTADTVGVNAVLGVACATTAASTYCWLQTRGISTVLTDAVYAIPGGPVRASTTVAGAVAAIVVTGTAVNAITNQKQAPVGYALLASGTTLNHIPVFLTIE